MNKIAVRHSPSGCWQVLRDTYVIDIYPSHMWHFAYKEACREAIWQNTNVIGGTA